MVAGRLINSLPHSYELQHEHILAFIVEYHLSEFSVISATFDFAGQVVSTVKQYIVTEPLSQLLRKQAFFSSCFGGL